MSHENKILIESGDSLKVWDFVDNYILDMGTKYFHPAINQTSGLINEKDSLNEEKRDLFEDKINSYRKTENTPFGDLYEFIEESQDSSTVISFPEHNVLVSFNAMAVHISLGEASQIEVLRLDNFQPIREIFEHNESEVVSVKKLSPNSLASWTKYGEIIVWEVLKQDIRRNVQLDPSTLDHSASIIDIFLLDDKKLLSYSENEIVFIDLKAGSISEKIISNGKIRKIVFTPENSFFVLIEDPNGLTDIFTLADS